MQRFAGVQARARVALNRRGTIDVTAAHMIRTCVRRADARMLSSDAGSRKPPLAAFAAPRFDQEIRQSDLHGTQLCPIRLDTVHAGIHPLHRIKIDVPEREGHRCPGEAREELCGRQTLGRRVVFLRNAGLRDASPHRQWPRHRLVVQPRAGWRGRNDADPKRAAPPTSANG